MSYSQEISRRTPAFFIFLLDQSGSMIEPIGGGGGKRKEEVVAELLNAWIENMIVSCAGADRVRNYMDVSVIGYCTDENGEPIIEPALGGRLAGRERVSITELAENVARLEDREREIFDEYTGEILAIPYQAKVWVEQKSNFGTPTCSALLKAYELAEAWTAEHSDSFPPIVINFTDGESTDAAPHEYAQSLRSLGTYDGNVLLFNCHMSMEESGGILFPSTAAELPLELDPNAQTLFNISSEFPEAMMESGIALGFELSPGARGMAFNADSVGIIKFLDMIIPRCKNFDKEVSTKDNKRPNCGNPNLGGLNLWPTALDFSRSLDAPSFAFKDADWKQGQFAYNKHGKVMMSGRFATVFKVTLPGFKPWAARVFTSGCEDRQNRYKEISKYVNPVTADSPFVEFEYLHEGIRNYLNGERYPFMPMAWVQGVTMFEWVTKQCQANNRKQLQAALLKWVDVMAYLKEHDFAHGDLEQGNIMFTDDDEIKLVDYDGMCVPSLQGLDALEAGVVPYQHPSRGAGTKLDSTLDHHSSIFIYVAMAALAEAPNLWQQFVLDQDYEKLLFKKEDLESPATSALFSALQTQAPDAYPMCLQLAELYNGDIAKVPALERFLHQ